MNTEKNRSSRKDAKMQRKQNFYISAPLRLCAIIPMLVLMGCTPEQEKIIPQDRLTVEYSIDQETLHVGDPVELILTAYFPTNGTLKLPEIGREKDVVLLKRDWENIPREDGLTQSESRYSITSFRIGEHVISTNMISCHIGNETFSTNFPTISLTVESSLDADASSKISDIKPIQKLPGRVPPWLWISALIALGAFLIGLITSKLWKHRETLIPGPPPIPPHVTAFHALEVLKGKELLEKDEYKPFYTELSLILRTYLDGRFSLNAPDETTEEIIEQLSSSPDLNGNQRNILQDFMRQADMVKFAKGHPDRTTMESAFDTTQQFVEQTKRNQTEDLATREHKELKEGNE